MAAPDPAHAGGSAERLQEERHIAAMTRKVRFQISDIHNKRERLRNKVREIQDAYYAPEAEYWSGYHTRLSIVSKANLNGSTRDWISSFGENEKKLVDVLVNHQDILREEARRTQGELAAVDREFWDVWTKHVDFVRGLTPMTPLPPMAPLSGSTAPATTVPVPAAPPQPAGNQESRPFPSTHIEGGIGQGGSIMHSPNGQTQSVLLNPRAKQFTMSGSTPAPAVGGFLQAPAIGAIQSTQGASPSMESVSMELTPSSSVPPQQDAGFETRSGAPSPKSRTPKSAPADSRNRGESSQEPADDPQPAEPDKAVAAASQSVQSTAAAVSPAKPSPLALPKPITQQNQDDGFVGVTHPVVGEIYQGYYKDDNCEGWWFCTPLPLNYWEREIGINFSFEKANLFKDLPGCYTMDQIRAGQKNRKKGRKTRNVITGWKKGFESGGPRVRERVFPVLFFDDTPGEPGNFKFPDSPSKAFNFRVAALRALPAEWVAAKDLRLPGADVGRPVEGRNTAGRFRERVRARKALLGEKMSRYTPTRANVGSSSAVEASSPLQDTTREDTEMADAESLSGATAVDETSVQPEGLEAPKTPSPPTAKIF